MHYNFKTSNMIKSIFTSLKNPTKLTLFIFLGFCASFIVSVIAKLIFGDASDSIMNYNPVFSGFIHGDPSHLMINLSLMFIFLIFNVNQVYDIKKLYIITFAISLIYLPVALATALPAVGISGTLYFMLTRACLNKRNIPLYIFYGITISYEFTHLFDVDGTAHGVHIIGSVLGYISLKEFKNKIIPAKLLPYIA